jgi:pilus assembly protein CpaE
MNNLFGSTPVPEAPIKILIVDDIPETRENLKKLLIFEPDMEVVGMAGTGLQAIEQAHKLLPDIILMDINMPDMDGIKASELIIRDMPDIGIIMISVQSESDYIRRAMLAGARYFLTKPVSGEELYHTIRTVKATLPKVHKAETAAKRPWQVGDLALVPTAKVVVVYSLQGGTGKTTIATNLAAGLMHGGCRVLLIDCALQSGDVGVFLNLNPQDTLIDLLERVDDLDMEVVNHVVATHPSGLRALLAPRTLEDADTIEPAKVVSLIGKLRSSFDFIIVDTSPVLDALNLELLDLADRVLLLSTPTLPSVKNARIVLDMAEKLAFEPGKIRLVLNRVNAEYERGKVTVAQQAIEGALKQPALAAIPDDERRVLAAINRGVTVIGKDPHLSPAKELLELVDTIERELRTENDQTPNVFEANQKSSRRFSRILGASA